MKINPVEQAINAVGSASELARRVGVTPAAIAKMRKTKTLATSKAVTPKEWSEITGLSKETLFPEYQD